MRISKIAKIGEERTEIHLWLGKLKVATIVRYVSYGVSYIPELKLCRDEGVYLSYFDQSDEEKTLKFKTVDAARQIIKKVCGNENFSRLKETKKYKSDVEEKEINQRFVWGELPP